MSGGATEAFRTHSNYIRSFACIAGWRQPDDDSDGVLAAIASRVKLSTRYAATQRHECDIIAVQSSLFNCWGTEVLLALAGVYALQDEMIRLSNNWAVVQLYYAVYHAGQALMTALGNQTPQTHEAMRQRFLDLWVNPKDPGPVMPLSLGYGAAGAINAPAGVQLDDAIPNWSSCDRTTCWSLALKALRTTRAEQLPKRFDKARKEKLKQRRQQWARDEAARQARNKAPRKDPTWRRPNLSDGEKEEVAQRLRDYSIVDYLYRLRARSNYEDVSMFSDGPEDDLVSARVHGDLTRLASSCLLIHELHVGQCVGASVLRGWADSWLASNYASPVPLGLSARRQLL